MDHLINNILNRLSQNQFRRRFRLDPKDICYVHEKGIDEIISHTQKFIIERLAPANPVNDGRQTPYRGHPVFIAQHATACCCRKCIQKWHQFPLGTELTSSQIDYLVRVIMAWIQIQMNTAMSAAKQVL